MRKLFILTLVVMLVVPASLAQTNVTIGSANCSVSTEWFPWVNYWPYSEAQYGIPSSALAPLSGMNPVTIDKIGWIRCLNEVPTGYSLNIYIDEVPDTYDLGTLVQRPYGNTNLVASNKTLMETSPNVFMLTLDTPFVYTPGNALIISVCNTHPGTPGTALWAANKFKGNGIVRFGEGYHDCDMLTDEDELLYWGHLWVTTVFSCTFTQDLYDLQMLPPDGTGGATGTVEPLPGTYSLPKGGSQPISALPTFGSDFDYWELDGAWFSDNRLDVVLMDENHSIQAFFKPFEALRLPFSEDFSGVLDGDLPLHWGKTPDTELWGVRNTSLAGGTEPEMYLESGHYSGQLRLITPKIDGKGAYEILLMFKHFVRHFLQERPYSLHVQTSIDDGLTWMDCYSLTPTHVVGPEMVEIELDDLTGKEFHVSFLFDGELTPNTLRGWCIDDVVIMADYKGLLKGVVTNDQGPIEGAIITVVETGTSTVTGPTGEYELSDTQGIYTITCDALGHNSAIEPDIEIIEREEVNLDFVLTYPLVDIYPTSFHVEQFLGESTKEQLHLENNGTGPLDFRVKVKYLDNGSSQGIGDWTDLSPVATAVGLPSSCFGDGKFFVISGYDNSQDALFNAIQIYDTSTGTWSRSSPMIKALSNSVAEYHEGKVYVIGGYGIYYSASDTVQIYDVASDTWSAGATMPTPRGGASGGLIDGKIYSLGGSIDNQLPTENVAYEYDIAGDSWRILSNGPVVNGAGIDLGSGCAYKGKIYAGGHAEKEYYQFYEFDPADYGTWTAKATIPTGLGGRFVSMVGLETESIILAVGGGYDEEPTGTTWSYDPDADTWTNLDRPMTKAVFGGACAAGYGEIYFYGGMIGGNTVEPAPFMMNTFETSTWLTTDITLGNVDPGDTGVVTLTFDSDEVSLSGMYSAELTVFHNSGDEIPLIIPATMLVKTSTLECDYLGSHLVISQEDPFRAGDTFWLECHVCNNTDTPMQQIATAVLLGVYGEFWFWPGWTQNFDQEYHDYLPGLTEIQVLDPFTWPDVQGTALGLEFYSGLINEKMNDLIGEYGYLTFGYTDQ